MTDLCGGQKRSGGTCGRPAGWGTTHPGFGRCKLHLGSVRNHVVHAETLQLAAEESRVSAEYGFGREVNVSDALMEALHAAAGRLDFWNAKVRQLAELTERGQAGSIDVHHYVRAAERAERDYAKVAGDCARLGLEVRKQQLAEADGARLADASRAYIAGVIDALGLDQAAAAPVMQRLFADMLRSLAGGPLQVTA